MLLCVAKTAVIRNGRVIPGGKPFGIRKDEAEAMDARGFRVFEKPDAKIPSDTVTATETKARRGRPSKSQESASSTEAAAGGSVTQDSTVEDSNTEVAGEA